MINEEGAWLDVRSRGRAAANVIGRRGEGMRDGGKDHLMYRLRVSNLLLWWQRCWGYRERSVRGLRTRLYLCVCARACCVSAHMYLCVCDVCWCTCMRA